MFEKLLEWLFAKDIKEARELFDTASDSNSQAVIAPEEPLFRTPSGEAISDEISLNILSFLNVREQTLARGACHQATRLNNDIICRQDLLPRFQSLSRKIFANPENTEDKTFQHLDDFITLVSQVERLFSLPGQPAVTLKQQIKSLNDLKTNLFIVSKPLLHVMQSQVSQSSCIDTLLKDEINKLANELGRRINHLLDAGQTAQPVPQHLAQQPIALRA